MIIVFGFINMDFIVIIDCLLKLGEIVVGCFFVIVVGGKGVNQVFVVI